MNILLVDDWEDIGVLLRRSIAKQPRQVQVKQVLDVREAIDVIKTFLPQIVILDVRLPSGSGLGLIQHVKGVLPQSTVIMFTGYADVKTELSAKDLGADYFFHKSDDYDRLVETINGLITMSSTNVVPRKEVDHGPSINPP